VARGWGCCIANTKHTHKTPKTIRQPPYQMDKVQQPKTMQRTKAERERERERESWSQGERDRESYRRGTTNVAIFLACGSH